MTGLPFLPVPRVVFSRCGRYRYFLEWPTYRANPDAMLFVGANPSSAGSINPNPPRDAVHNLRSDPTVSRMANLASHLRLGRLWVVNVRSYVSTDPAGVPPDPIGIGSATNDWIRASARNASLVICAWGHLAGERGDEVLALIREVGAKPYALALTKNGTPRHPRGVPKSAGLVEL